MARLGMIAAVFAAAALAAPADAATIGTDRFGCQSKERMDRIYRVANQGDEKTFAALVNEGFATGDCIRWRVGEEVVSFEQSWGLMCLAARGTTACYWTPEEALAK